MSNQKAAGAATKAPKDAPRGDEEELPAAPSVGTDVNLGPYNIDKAIGNRLRTVNATATNKSRREINRERVVELHPKSIQQIAARLDLSPRYVSQLRAEARDLGEIPEG